MMAQNVFSVASPVGKMLSKITRGWSANLVKAAKIWLQGGIYGSKGIQTALQACFGSGKLLVAPIQPQTHVAVTTTIGEDPPCRLLTSYVRTNPERRYGRWDRPRDVRVWEACVFPSSTMAVVANVEAELVLHRQLHCRLKIGAAMKTSLMRFQVFFRFAIGQQALVRWRGLSHEPIGNRA